MVMLTYPAGQAPHIGWEGYPGHKGEDSGWGSGTNVYAAAPGQVVYVYGGGGDNGGWGNQVIVQHAGNVYTTYNHFKTGSIAVAPGSEVVRGQFLGTMGDTGRAEGVHLHFELRIGGIAPWDRVNPAPYYYTDLPGTEPETAPTPAPEPEEDHEDDMTLYFEATENSTPLTDGTSRIWAGEGRKVKSRDAEGRVFEATYSGVWERSPDGSIRRLFAAEWPAIRAAIEASGRKVPIAQVHGNAIEQMYLVARTEPVL